MLHRGSWTVAVVAAVVMAIGAGPASAAGPTVHVGRISGVVKPVAQAGAVHLNSPTIAPFAVGGSDSTSAGCPCGSPPVLYGGGPVMHIVDTHVIAWAPAGYSFPSGYVGGYEQYLSDLGHDLGLGSNVSSVLAQYVDANGSALQRLTNFTPISDTTPYPASGCTVSRASVCLTETQLVSELEADIGNLITNNLTESYTLLLPPGVDSCYDSSSQQCEDQYFCGYHSALYAGHTWVTFSVVPYTASAYSNASGECYASGGPMAVSPDLMALDTIGTHELFESATDPLGAYGYLDSTQNEVADECAWDWGTTKPATGGGAYNQLINGNQYLIQEMWSDQAQACLQGEGSVATASITPVSPVLVNTPARFTASLTGDSSSATSYSWSYAKLQYGTPFPGTPVSNAYSGANPQITFPSPGIYTVWVEITDAAGGTITGVTDVSVDGPPTSAFSWSWYSTEAGATVSFTGEATAGAGSITAYSWNFGDGGTSTAANPSHVYSATGNYTVTLKVTQTDGLIASAQQTIGVTVPTASGGGSGSGAGGGTAGSSGSAGTGGSGGSTAPASASGQAASTSWLNRTLAVPAAQLHISSLLKKNDATMTVTSVAVAGRLTITWYATVKHHRIAIARGSQAVSAGKTAHIVIRLTAAGRALLKKSKSVKVTVLGSYMFGSSSIASSKTLTIKK